MAKNLVEGDLVTHRDRKDDLFIVIGYTYRVSSLGQQKTYEGVLFYNWQTRIYP